MIPCSSGLQILVESSVTLKYFSVSDFDTIEEVTLAISGNWRLDQGPFSLGVTP